MGMIYVMSTPMSTYEILGTLRTSLLGTGTVIKKIKVKLINEASSDGLRFWLIGYTSIDNRCCFCTYENGEMTVNQTEHVVANQAKLLEIDSNGNVEKTVAFMSHGMTKETLESIPESVLLEKLQRFAWLAVVIGWEQNGAVSSAKFPVKSVEITGKRYHGENEEFDSNQPLFVPAATKVVDSKTYEFETPRTIKYSDFNIDKDALTYASNVITPNDPNYHNYNEDSLTHQYGRGVALRACFKHNDGTWSSWELITPNMTDQENVIAMKLRAQLKVTSPTYTWGTGSAAQTIQGYTGPAWINSVTFDRQTATGTYIGGNFTTRTLHLANIAKKVHATLVHKDGLNVKAYVSLRSEGNFVSGESLGVGTGNRQSVTLQHTTGLTNEGFKLYFNGVEQAVSSYSFASGSGLVTFTAPSGVSVKCDYYYNAGAENFVEMTRTATYRNEDKPGMLESQFKYETTTGGNVATLKAEVAGDGRIEEMAVFFNQ